MRVAVATLTILSMSWLIACSGNETPAPSPDLSAVATPSGPVFRIVAIGDSSATGAGDPGGTGWVGMYADLVAAQTGATVELTNLAEGGRTSEQQLNDLTGNAFTEQAITQADVVLVGIGGADLNAGDAALEAGSCKGRGCYEQVLRRFSRHIKAIASEVRRLNPGVMLRAITLANSLPGAEDLIPDFITPGISLYQAERERRAICIAMQENAGECIDLLREFNGPSGTDDAYASGMLSLEDCCYPSGEGHLRIAELLIASGLPNVAG